MISINLMSSLQKDKPSPQAYRYSAFIFLGIAFIIFFINNSLITRIEMLQKKIQSLRQNDKRLINTLNNLPPQRNNLEELKHVLNFKNGAEVCFDTISRTNKKFFFSGYTSSSYELASVLSAYHGFFIIKKIPHRQMFRFSFEVFNPLPKR